MIELPILDGHSSGDAQPGGKRYWRSFGHLRDDPAFRHARQGELMPGAPEAPSGASRRQFLQLMGASLALGGLTACRKPVERILPYTRPPEEVIPGIPLYYATVMPFQGIVRGLLVETHEGRPTKIEGNPQHPTSFGTTSAFEQASVLSLYDPDRSRRTLHANEEATLNEFVAFYREFLAEADTSRIVVVSDALSSPTMRTMRDRLQNRFPQLQWVTYTPAGDDPAVFGAQSAFGRPYRPVYHFTEESVIVSLDADFLGPTEPNFILDTRDFANSRDVEVPEDGMSRLYTIESGFSMTGAKADHRLRLKASEIPAFAAALAGALGVAGADGQAAAFADHPYVSAIAEDLRRAGQNGVVIAGDTQPAAVHALAMAMNAALGSIGNTVALLDTQEEPRLPAADQLRRLAADMRAGQVDALVFAGTNPVYTAPGELNFAEAMQQVPVTIHLGLHVDETAILSTWHVPQTHYLEAWGDGRAYDGTLSVIQPMIAPLYEEAVSDVEFVSFLATGDSTPGYDLVREHWQQAGYLSGDFETSWRRTLHDGFVPDTGYLTVAPALTSAPTVLPAVDSDALELVFRLDPKVLDGRFSNNAWLQELPHPITKHAWGNLAMMSPATAEVMDLRVEYDAGRYFADVIRIEVNGRSIDLPIWIIPGYPNGTIGVTFGYGREIRSFREHRDDPFWETAEETDIYGAGALATGIGANVYPLRTAALERVVIGPNVTKVGGGYLVATTQEHGTMEGRPIVREAELEEFRQNPDFAEDAVEPLAEGEPWDTYPTLWQERHASDDKAFKDSLYFEHQWGMSIDLNRCTGCSACVIACQSENNIPSVGPEPLSYGREMLWLRVDRYFVGDGEGDESPGMVFQPMFCVHCENAPCEYVCPVYATSHSPDGISEMTYNRCIGTRYCSNNCPYKVRRFNFFNWTKTMPASVQMQMNPNVTVRFRGVMEKCTYCVQRIREVNRREIIEDRPMQDGEVLTACQQVCPADAIIFGDINDPASRVSREKQLPRNYGVLAELNVKPRTSFQAVVRNPNPALTNS